MPYADPQLVHTLQVILEFLGTFAFAISGIRHAAQKHFDWFGGYVCGFASCEIGNKLTEDEQWAKIALVKPH